MVMGFEFLVAAALATPVSNALPRGVRVEARASARIIRGARLHWESHEVPQDARLTRASVQIEDGTRRPARLIEFE
jgi:hypothetical protein